jgi:hypothetical protein
MTTAGFIATSARNTGLTRYADQQKIEDDHKDDVNLAPTPEQCVRHSSPT